MPQKIKIVIVSPQGVEVTRTWLEQQQLLWLQSLASEDNEVGQGVPCPSCDDEGCTCGCTDPHRKD